MKRFRRIQLAAALTAALPLSACYDLSVTDPNEPDFEAAYAEADAAVASIVRSFQLWFAGSYDHLGPGYGLSNASFQHTTPFTNSTAEILSRIPRPSVPNPYYESMTFPWLRWYEALRAAADGVRALQSPTADALSPEDRARALAFGRFVQGLVHASIAVLYAEGFVLDEKTDLSDRSAPVAYGELMEAALGYLSESASLASEATWTLPESWMRTPLRAPELAQVARSMTARYRAAVARTPDERSAVDWAQVLADVGSGIQTDLVLDMGLLQWRNEVLGYGTYAGWTQLGFFVYGMADQSGNYQMWDAQPTGPVWGELGKSHTVNGRAMLIVTPDLRFPRGSTLEEQRLSPGLYFRVNQEGPETGSTWARPDRGTWRWSWYKHARGEEYWRGIRHQREIRMEEMRLLEAEALYRLGDRAGAASIVNETRVLAGLSPTDAAGINTSCVPRLPNGTCGDLLEMLKWEKRMENTFKGPLGNLWYFDGRGWGDLWKGTLLHLPLPCTDATVIGAPCLSFGGAGGRNAAASSVYRWSGEG